MDNIIDIIDKLSYPVITILLISFVLMNRKENNWSTSEVLLLVGISVLWPITMVIVGIIRFCDNPRETSDEFTGFLKGLIK